MTIKELNAVMTAARDNYKNGVKSPIKLMNIMNGSAFKNDPAMKAALEALGASKWSLDLAPRTIAGRQICKLGAEVEDIQALEPGAPVAAVAGKLYHAERLEAFRGDEFIAICKKRRALELKKEAADQKAADKAAKEKEKAEKKAEKEANKEANKEASKAKAKASREANKARKAAEKKASDRLEMIDELFTMGTIDEAQRDAMIAALTVKKTA